MIALAASSFICLFLFLSFGSSLAKLLRIEAGYACKALLGLAACNTLTCILSLFFPIELKILGLVLALALPLAWCAREDLKQLFSLASTNRTVLQLAAPFLAIAFVMALGSPTRVFDTGLYHLQSIMWIEQYPVVPGLANLHGRFGFNPNIFSFCALTSLRDLFGQEIFAVNFTLYAVLVIHFVARVHTLYREQGLSPRLFFFAAVLLQVIFSSSVLASPSPNFITVAVPMFVLCAALPVSRRGGEGPAEDWLALALISVYVVTVKLAGIPLLVLALLLALRHRGEGRRLFWLCLASLVVVLPWLARNIILTGWLLYPFPALDLFQVDWKVPLKDVIFEKAAVTGWARNPGEPDVITRAAMGLSQWFPLWWRKLLPGHKLLFCAALLSPALTALAALRRRAGLDYYSYAVVVTSLAGVVFWFVLGPAIRFGEPFLILSALSPLLCLDFDLRRHWQPGAAVRAALYATVILAFAWNAKNLTYFQPGRILLKPQPIARPAVPFKSFRTSTVDIYYPESEVRCCDHELPCSPMPVDGTLALRGSGLAQGFRRVTLPLK